MTTYRVRIEDAPDTPLLGVMAKLEIARAQYTLESDPVDTGGGRKESIIVKGYCRIDDITDEEITFGDDEGFVWRFAIIEAQKEES